MKKTAVALFGIMMASTCLVIFQGSPATGVVPGVSVTTAVSAPTYAGWCAGNSLDGYGMILHTSDGLNWTRQGSAESVPDAGLSGVAALDADDCWVVGDVSDGYGTILRTRDGGTTWIRQGSAATVPDEGLLKISAVDADTAWAVGSNGTVIFTGDGGGTWASRRTDAIPPVNLQGVFAVDADNVWVTGGPDGGYGTICRTTDGGLTWERKGSLGVLPISQIQDVKAVDQDSAWFVNSSTGGHAPEMSALHTPDNGATWESFKLGTAGDTNGVAVVGDSIVWAAADYSGIFRTDDNGADGFPQQTAAPGSFYLMTIDAEDSDTAWLCGGIHDGTGHHGVIEHTSDGGGTWVSQIEVAIELTGISMVKLDENTYTWYLPEGSTGGGMETWILVENPGPDPVTVDLVFDTGSGEVAQPSLAGLTVPAESRISCDVTSFITTYDLSTRVIARGGRVDCERATYGNGRAWGTSSTGYSGTATQWCMAEGATGGDMESWVVIENPNPDPADVNVRFLTGAGEVAGPTATLAPHTRSTCRVNDWVTTYDVAVEVTSSIGVVCERATYGGAQGEGWAWGTSSAGTPFASAQWYVPGIHINSAWLLIANPNSTAAGIDIKYYFGDRIFHEEQAVVPARSRFTINAGDIFPHAHVSSSVDLPSFIPDGYISAIVTSTGAEVVCEWAEYAPDSSWGISSLAAPGLGPDLFFTEGSTDGGMRTSITLFNPGDAAVAAGFVLYTGTGRVLPPALQNVVVPARGTFTADLNDYVTSYDVSTLVIAEEPLTGRRVTSCPDSGWRTASGAAE